MGIYNICGNVNLTLWEILVLTQELGPTPVQYRNVSITVPLQFFSPESGKSFYIILSSVFPK